MPPVASAPPVTSDEVLIVNPMVNDLVLKTPSYHLLFWDHSWTNLYRLGSPDAVADVCRDMACRIFIRDPHLWEGGEGRKTG